MKSFLLGVGSFGLVWLLATLVAPWPDINTSGFWREIVISIGSAMYGYWDAVRSKKGEPE